MKANRIFLITLVVLILFTLALPAAMGSRAMGPAQPALPVVQSGLVSPSTSVVWSTGCGSWSTFEPLRSPIVCPNVSWNS